MNPQNIKSENIDLANDRVKNTPSFLQEADELQNSLGDRDSAKFRKSDTHDKSLIETNLIPVGPNLPPGKSMKFTTNFLMKTKLRIINQNVKLASVSVDGIGHLVPEFKDFSPGILDLTAAWKFGKAYIITNQCDWVLRVEYK